MAWAYFGIGWPPLQAPEALLLSLDSFGATSSILRVLNTELERFHLVRRYLHHDELQITPGTLAKLTLGSAFRFLHLLTSYLLYGSWAVLMYYQSSGSTGAFFGGQPGMG